MYLIKRAPSLPLNCGISEETWTDKEVNLNHLRIFGCISYVQVELDRRSKLDPKSERCIFIGHRTNEYVYLFWDPENRKIFGHKDVVFNEKKMYKDLLTKSTLDKDPRVTPRALRNSRMLRTRSSLNLMMFL